MTKKQLQQVSDTLYNARTQLRVLGGTEDDVNRAMLEELTKAIVTIETEARKTGE